MYVAQAAVEADGAISHDTIYEYLDADAVSRNEIEKAFWLLERLDVLATDDHSNYLPKISSDIYMALYTIATDENESTSGTAYDGIALREFTLPRLLILDVLTSKHYQGGFTMNELEEYYGILETDANPALSWLLGNDLIIINDDESYTINKKNPAVKNFHRIHTNLSTYGGAMLHHDTAATIDHYNKHNHK